MDSITFIRHAESYANQIKREDNQTYLSRKIVHKKHTD